MGDEPVWPGRSTYLRRGGGTARSRRGPSDPPTGPASLVRVPDDIGRRYAAVSGDRNPIHLHALAAKAFGFPSAIAHGMWLKARALAALEGRLPDAFTVDVAFKTAGLAAGHDRGHVIARQHGLGPRRAQPAQRQAPPERLGHAVAVSRRVGWR